MARQLGGIEMLKPSAARVTVDQLAGSGAFVGDGEGVGLGVGVGDGATEADGDEQATARISARVSIWRRITARS